VHSPQIFWTRGAFAYKRVCPWIGPPLSGRHISNPIRFQWGTMDICCWVHSSGVPSEEKPDLLREMLVRKGVKVQPFQRDAPGRLGACVFGAITPELQDFVQAVSWGGQRCVIAIAASRNWSNGTGDWDLLRAGVSDVLVWSDLDRITRQIKARFERWLSVEQVMEEPMVSELVVAKSPVWRTILRNIVAMARFSNATMLILGESGTGKEVVARLIHLLDERPNKRDLTVLDCSSIVPELSGSEFFGHERGAFTGASTERHGAFALANGGTLFLDEIGELPLPLQAQLLRVVQERTYKRVGGNTWYKTAFRLVCATNRNLLDLIDRGAFRADLYHRIAGCVCKLPPLRERLEDIIPLAEYFLRRVCPDGHSVELDAAVREYLLRREYPGNVRDLQQVVSRMMHRAADDGTISIGCVPADERPVFGPDETAWLDFHFERSIQRAVLLGAGLKEIGRAAEDIAIRYATDEEEGNLRRAARRLGVTDRALQLRRANRRQIEEVQVGSPYTRNDLELNFRRGSESAVFG
jgi:transcriptional regulator with GAF, ATPase, and Fis domain